jgi:O-antigen/teichoic acid export membrane protein
MLPFKKHISIFFSDHSIKATALAGMLAQLSRPLVSLLTLPLLLTHLGQDGIGIWMIALSILGLIGFVNTGLSATVVTTVGRLGANYHRDEINHLISASTLLALAWGAFILIVAIPLVLFIDWGELLHLNGKISGDDVSKLMAVLVLMMACGFVVSLPQQIMLGRMQGALAHVLNFFGVIAGAIGFIIAIYFEAPLWILGFAFMAPTIITSYVGGLIYFHYSGITFFTYKNFSWNTVRWLGNDSLRMAGYQSAYAVSSQSDLLLIGMILGSSASAAYGIAHRVFSLPILLSSIVSQAQWPAMANFDATGDHAAVGKMLKHTVAIGSFAGTTSALILALFYEPLIRLWLGSYITTDWWILGGMVAWVIVATLVTIFDSVLRARLDTSFLMRCMFFMALINILASLLLIPVIGAGGAIWGSVLGYIVALAIPYSFRLWRLYEKYY